MSEPTPQTGSFRGGVTIPRRTEYLGGIQISSVPVPPELVLPLAQSAGRPALAMVRPGDRVLRGQQIARADGLVSAALHSPSSGRVAALEHRPLTHPSGLSGSCIVIATDGADQALPRTPLETDYHQVDPVVLRIRIGEAGIVGLGGAVFPTSVKLTAEAHFGLHTLVLNGAECDPYINCDDVLMQTRADAVIEGARVLLHVLQVNHCIIAIEDDKPDAAAALEGAVVAADEDRFEFRRVPSRYPEGSERQLLQVLSGKEVPHDGLPLDIGYVCINVATAAAVRDAIVGGRPLISRLVSVCGTGVVEPRVVEARLGTPINRLIEFCGGYADDVDRIVVGGVMMGHALRDDTVPVVKATNSVLVMASQAARKLDAVLPCIRCGECANVCPAGLQPQLLHWHAKGAEFERCRELAVVDCIECGCCDYVCPSHIPLAEFFRYAKAELHAGDVQRRQSQIARARYESREQRLAVKAAEKAARLARRKSAVTPAADTAENEGKRVIAEALERTRAKRAAQAEAQQAESKD